MNLGVIQEEMQKAREWSAQKKADYKELQKEAIRMFNETVHRDIVEAVASVVGVTWRRGVPCLPN